VHVPPDNQPWFEKWHSFELGLALALEAGLLGRNTIAMLLGLASNLRKENTVRRAATT
jgi:hypothetical protein